MEKSKISADRWKRKPLTIWDRQYILQMKERGLRVREISRKLGRNHSVVSRFLDSIPYSPYLASLTALEKAREMDRRSRINRSKPRKKERLKCVAIRRYVEEKLVLGWSPELIAGRLPLEHPDLSTNYESIYQWIYNERRDLIQYLHRRGKDKPRKRSGKRKQRHKQPAEPKQSIELRPEIVDTRSRIGDWEGDTLVSKQSTAALFNLVERSSRYLELEKLANCSSESGSEATIRILSNVPPELRKTITLDNGPENSAHQKVDAALGTETYFCHPYCASERGTVENRNGFIRRFLPKKTDFANISEEEIQRIQDEHNHRPMKCLKFRTPHEVFWQAFKQNCNA